MNQAPRRQPQPCDQARPRAAQFETRKLQSLASLAGGVAHGFNNLLLSIQGNAHLALLDLDRRSPARAMLQEIEAACERAAALTGRLLACAGEGMSSVRRLDLADLVAKVAQRSPGRGIGPVTFELEIADAPAWIRADAAQLRQVVEDLVANAGEALGGEHGKVTLACGVVHADRAFLAESYLADDVPEGEYAYVEVRDTGCGIDPEKLEKIFDPFYTTKFPGRGLGLAAVLGVVRSHRGALKVRSDPERGTSFQALFPRCDPPSLASASRPSRSLEGEGTGTILVVDDEEAVRAVTRRMLERDGFRVLSAAGGEEATVLLRQHRSEVAGVVLDMSMPKMDGEATFHQLRRIREDLPVLFVSGHSKQDLAHRLIGKVRADFLQKPFTLATLSEKLRAQL